MLSTNFKPAILTRCDIPRFSPLSHYGFLPNSSCISNAITMSERYAQTIFTGFSHIFGRITLASFSLYSNVKEERPTTCPSQQLSNESHLISGNAPGSSYLLSSSQVKVLVSPFFLICVNNHLEAICTNLVGHENVVSSFGTDPKAIQSKQSKGAPATLEGSRAAHCISRYLAKSALHTDIKLRISDFQTTSPCDVIKTKPENLAFGR